MVLSFLLNVAVDATVFTVKYAYSWGRYFVYGHEETTDEKLDRIIKEYTEIKEELTLIKGTVHEKEELKTTVSPQIPTNNVNNGERQEEAVCESAGSA
jgi:hypothetical protein